MKLHAKIENNIPTILIIYWGVCLIFGVCTIMKINYIVLVSCLFICGSKLFSQTSDSVIVRNSHREVQKIRYHPPQYRYVPTPRNYISGFGLGIDYTNESFTNLEEMAWDSSENYISGSSGFSMYGLVMPRTIRKLKETSPNLGSFNWGFGFNVNQFHKSSKERVVINTINQDSAHTRLETSNFSLYTMSRYEWAMGRVFPFVGVQAGFSLLSTDQVTETYMVMTEYESHKQENLTTNVAYYWAPEVGVRFRLGTAVSAVLSHEWKMGSQIDLADVNNTQFDGLQLSATSQKVTYQTSMWKIGFLFDLSSNHGKKVLIHEAYTDTTMVMERIYDENPCPPCPCETEPEPRTKTVPNSKTDMEVNPTQETPATVSPKTSTPTVPNIRIPKKSMPAIIAPKPPKKKS